MSPSSFDSPDFVNLDRDGSLVRGVSTTQTSNKVEFLDVSTVVRKERAGAYFCAAFGPCFAGSVASPQVILLDEAL